MREPIYYVKIIHGGDWDNIPISMFGQPAIFQTREKAETFAEFSSHAGHRVEVCEWPEVGDGGS